MTVQNMAGRIRSLIQDIERALSHQPHGSPRYVKQRQYILLALVEDLREINHAIPRLNSLNSDIIRKLIQRWQAQGNENNTIYYKISVLRRICKHYLKTNPIPSNQELGLIYQKSERAISLDIELSTETLNLNLRALYQLQYHFGLKMTEAIQIESYMFDNEGLWLARVAAYNNRNRFIPYWCEEQKQLVRNLLLNTNLSANDKNLLSLQYKAALQHAGIKDHEYYRWQYINQRYAHLIGIDGNNHLQVLKQLRTETGYRENRQIKVILKCLNAF